MVQLVPISCSQSARSGVQPGQDSLSQGYMEANNHSLSLRLRDNLELPVILTSWFRFEGTTNATQKSWDVNLWPSSWGAITPTTAPSCCPTLVICHHEILLFMSHKHFRKLIGSLLPIQNETLELIWGNLIMIRSYLSSSSGLYQLQRKAFLFVSSSLGCCLADCVELTRCELWAWIKTFGFLDKKRKKNQS